MRAGPGRAAARRIFAAMNPAALLDFLHDLAHHNDREWFQDHKSIYDRLRAGFEQDVAYWLRELVPDEPALAGLDPRKCIFRIYRDVRFSKVKVPYKTHFSAYFAPGGKHSEAPGRYVQIGTNGQTLVAGGLYEPTKEQLAAIRQEIDYSPEELHARLATPEARQFFPQGLAGDQLKKMPPGYEASHPEANWLRHKQFLLMHYLPDAEVRKLSPEAFRAHILAALRALGPFGEWLGEASHGG
ncbi:DUF2461 domain-containing protein [Hymenobacter cheonanensis]|uniref:DUF2461 domain-containing protein n=1 Tax=Hymenobacter sp. CA2-7 TaxID=3063993 RepID=UPI0027125716|nr:DUF2461 domain-containing protein [Hymenobacter sp. CA2-7]MDO7886461.1 DUF2461 domain-containing protein [Hymenobacter sp. CA2-7]